MVEMIKTVILNLIQDLPSIQKIPVYTGMTTFIIPKNAWKLQSSAKWTYSLSLRARFTSPVNRIDAMSRGLGGATESSLSPIIW